MKRFVKALAAVMLMTMMVFAVGCKPDEEPNDNGGGNGNNNTVTHEYVDLGLPSGTLWAACNVGATTPEGYGDYFAWGETETKSVYNWSTYKYAKGTSWDDPQLTKYCGERIFGYNCFVDTLVVLQPSDDAARVNWGSSWIIPTREQWEELYQNTTNTWTTQNGVNGWLFTASNGNSLFLPASSGHGDDEFYGLGWSGCYWSSSLCIAFPSRAWCFCFDPKHYYMYYHYVRPNGMSVRAVRSAK